MVQNFIFKDFPGGNIQVNSIQANEIHLEQEMRDSNEWWFYWCFCVKNLEGNTIRFVFDNGEVLGPHGPAISHDMVNWQWVGKQSLIDGLSFEYTFDKNEKQAYFSFSIPYFLSHFETFAKRMQIGDAPTYTEFGLTEKGRPIPCVRYGNPNCKKHIYFTCRHHACESTASYLMEGTIERIMDEPKHFWDNHCLHIFPFVDLDGVENGDQGKSRLPHDHNRDYIDKPLYRFTQILYGYVEKYPPYIFADYHSPWKWGDRNDRFFIVKSPSIMGQRQDIFASTLAEIVCQNATNGDIPFDPCDNIDAGITWNTGCNPTSTKFFIEQGAYLALGFEVPYFGIDDIVYTADGLRRLGQSVGEGFVRYCDMIEQ